MLVTSSLILDFLILLAVLIYILHLNIARKFTYWKERGIYTPEIKPIVGHFLDVILLRTTAAEWMKSYYDKVDKDYFGIYVFNEPFLVLKNPAIIKDVLIKDFKHFIDRNIASPDHSPVMSHLLFNQKNPGWRYGRTKLTAAFTSGRLRSMLPTLAGSADILKKFLVDKQEVLEAKTLVARYTTDVISKVAFGMDAKCFDEKDSLITYYRKKIFEFSLRNAFSQAVYFFKPSWVNPFKLEFVERKALDFFTDSFIETMKSRPEKAEGEGDLVDMMIRIKKGMNVTDGTDDATFCGAALQFFIAGFETISTTLSYTLYEFAIKPDVQKKVREEINNVLSKHGSATYDALKELTYTDMCLTETLRRYPVLPFIERKCNIDYQIPGTDFTIEKDTPLLIPMYALQMDEQYFPEPFTYDPERWRDGKLDQSNGLYFLPFGEGPRRCIGDRFARMAAKMCIISIIGSYEVTRCSKTPDPIIFEPKSFLLQSTIGTPMKFSMLQ